MDQRPSLSEWLGWPTQRMAAWLRARPQPVVMGWPFNGTRRWYLSHRLRHPDAADYLTVMGRRQAEMHRMVFDHGVGVLVAPHFGTELLGRGPEYTLYALGGLTLLAEDPVYREMHEAGLRVRFYGDYREKLEDEPVLRPVLEACAMLEDATASGDGPLLLIGLFADAPHETLARLSVEFAATHDGRPPDRAELIEAYYGLPIPDIGLYLGFAQHAVFDVPLLATGEEDLYATLAPSPDLTQRQLRQILYDHLLERRIPEPDYAQLSPEALKELTDYGQHSKGITLGLGRVDPLTGIWRPSLPDPRR